MPKNTQIMLMKKLFLLYNKDAEPEVDLTAVMNEINWGKCIDPDLSFSDNRINMEQAFRDKETASMVLEVGYFTLYPKDTRESEDKWLMQEKGWRILKEQVVKTHRVKGYEYGSAVVSLPKGMVGHRIVLAVLDLTAKEETEQHFREFEKGEQV